MSAQLRAAARVEPREPVALGGWFSADTLVRGLLLLFAITLPFVYDLSVPEVAGDIRWSYTHLIAGICGLILLGQRITSGKSLWSGRMPLLGWLAVAYVLWDVISMVDALNVYRAYPLIKAISSQVLVGFCVAAVWTPRFGRQMVWAITLPVFFVAFLGTSQFFGWSDASFAATVLPSWLGWAWPGGIIDPLMAFYQQSAIPGASFANKNLAGSWTGMMIPLIGYLLLTSRTRFAQGVASLLLAAGVLFLIYSRARATWVSVVLGAAVLLGAVIVSPTWRALMLAHLRNLAVRADKRRTDWARLAMILPAILVACWQFNVISPLDAHGINNTPGAQVDSLAEANWNDIGGRLAYNLNSIDIVKDYWFNGVGLGSFYVVYPAYNSAIVPTPTNSYSVMARPQRSHSDMVQAFDEAGIPGGLLFVSLFAVSFLMAFGLATRRSGAMALTIAGLGYVSMLVGICLLVMKSGIVPHTGLALGVFGVMGAALLALLARMALKERHELASDKALLEMDRDEPLFGLFAGTALVTIFTNCLMDFPFQLPTAPAVVALLMGGIAWDYGRRHPGALTFGFRRSVDFGRAGLIAMWVLLAALLGIYLRDDIRFRESNQLLKTGMIRIMLGITDDETLRVLTQANTVYPYDPRIHEHLAVTYANYQGTQQIPIEERIEKIESFLKGDQWGANHLINLCGQYLLLADIHMQRGNVAVAKAALARVHELEERLKLSAGSSFYLYGIMGMAATLEQRYPDATLAFEQALRIEPNYGPARNGLERLQAIAASGTAPMAPAPAGAAK